MPDFDTALRIFELAGQSIDQTFMPGVAEATARPSELAEWQKDIDHRLMMIEKFIGPDVIRVLTDRLMEVSRSAVPTPGVEERDRKAG